MDKVWGCGEISPALSDIGCRSRMIDEFKFLPSLNI